MENNFLLKLDSKKIEINWNKKPITMELFLSFLKVETEISRDHLGYGNGWTRRINKEIDLYIRGGVVGGVNYLDSIEYGKNKANRYNNYVNPFYLFDIMTDEGKKFFLEYYKEDIENVLLRIKDKIQYHREQVKKQNLELTEAKNILKKYRHA